MTALDHGTLKLLLKPFHGVPQHDLPDPPLLADMHRNVIIGGFHVKDVPGLDGEAQLLGLIPEADHLFFPELLGGILHQVLQLVPLVLEGKPQPGEGVGNGQHQKGDEEQACEPFHQFGPGL